MPDATALDNMHLCMMWAKAKKIDKAPPGSGSYSPFDEQECKKKFLEGHSYLGRACNIFALSLKKWAVENQKVSLIEAKAYANKHFPVAKLLA